MFPIITCWISFLHLLNKKYVVFSCWSRYFCCWCSCCCFFVASLLLLMFLYIVAFLCVWLQHCWSFCCCCCLCCRCVIIVSQNNADFVCVVDIFVVVACCCCCRCPYVYLDKFLDISWSLLSREWLALCSPSAPIHWLWKWQTAARARICFYLTHYFAMLDKRNTDLCRKIYSILNSRIGKIV